MTIHRCRFCPALINPEKDPYAKGDEGYECLSCFMYPYEYDEPDAGRRAITYCFIGIGLGLVGLAVWWGR